MTARDRAIVLCLVALLAVLTVAIGAPAFLPATSPDPFASNPGSSASASPGPIVGYREGVLGQPVSIDPLTASTQVDRDLVALVYSGLVKLGPNGTLLPDLASGWTVNAKGTQYVFTIRADAQWQDGEPVTSADVAYTIGALKDPDYTGPGASSWREVTLTVIDPHTVTFDLATPVGGFLYASAPGAASTRPRWTPSCARWRRPPTAANATTAARPMCRSRSATSRGCSAAADCLNYRAGWCLV